MSFTFALTLLLMPGPCCLKLSPDPLQLNTQNSDPWFGEDKLQHAFASLTVVAFAYGGSRTATLEHSPALAVAITAGAFTGVWKEWRDRKAGKPFSARDLLWDALGIGAGAVLMSQARE